MTRSIRTAALLVGLALGVAVGLPPVHGQAPPQAPNPCVAAGSGPAGVKPAAPAAAQPETPAAAQILEGTDQDDRLIGGSGDDWLLGKNGADVLIGCDGKDKIDGGDGEDRIDAGPAADIVDAGAGRDIVAGGDGTDALDGGDNEDQLDGGSGDDDLDGGDDNDVLRGGPGADVLAGADGDDQLSGDVGNDRVSGEDGSDVLSGGAGDDIVVGGEGSDSLSGDAGDDRLDGGAGIDLLRGGAGNDTLLGSSGGDLLHGEAGHDFLLGGDDADLLDGGPGLDWLMGGTGVDTMLGGGGDDLVLIRGGDVPAGEVEIINGGEGNDTLFLSGFTRPMMAGGEARLVDPVTGGVYIIVNIERIEYTTVLAMGEQAAGQQISLLLVNPSATAASGRVIFFGAGGTVVPAAIVGQPTRDDLTFSIPPFGSSRVTAALAQPAVAQVFATSPVAAMIQGGAGGTGLRGPSALNDLAVVPILERPDHAAGVLVANSLTGSSIKLTLRGMDGGELDGQVTTPHLATLPAYGSRQFFLRDVFPTIKNFQGTLTIESGFARDWPQEGGPISVVLLDRGPDGRIEGVPAVPMYAGSGTGSTHFARVVAASGATSSLVLVNPSSTTRAVGTLRLFDSAGNPWAVIGDRPNTRPTAAFDLGPAGSAVFPISPAAPADQGSARADVAQGRIAAMLRVTSSGQIVHLAANELFEGFITGVRRDRAGNVSASVAVSGPGSPVTVRFKLRTAAGADVAGGEAEIQLPANGQAVRTLEQLFPSASIDSFDGTLTVRAEGGSISASVLQTGPGTTTPVALAVIRLQ